MIGLNDDNVGEQLLIVIDNLYVIKEFDTFDNDKKDAINKNFLNLMNQGTILEKTLYWFSNLYCCTGNNSDVDVNLAHINDNGKIM